MSRKKNSKPKSKVTRVIHPSQENPRLKCLGGSQSDTWNNILINQTLRTLWVKHSDTGALRVIEILRSTTLGRLSLKAVEEGAPPRGFER